MKETLGTIRAYLLLAGVLGFMVNGNGIAAPGLPVWSRLLCVLALSICCLFFYLGVTYESRIRTSPSFVLQSFRVVMVLQLLSAGLELAIAVAYALPPIPFSLIGFAIAWYLHAQSKRLIREATEEPAQ